MHRNSWIQKGKTKEKQSRASTGGRVGLRTSAGRICGHSLQVSGSQPGVILPCKDIFSCHNQRVVAVGTLQCIGQPELFKILQNYLAQSVSLAKVQKPQ